MNPVINIKVRHGERVLAMTGRKAWALHALIEHPEGVSALDVIGPRWSHYIWLLRRDGLVIETVHEAHAGPFAGTHAKYKLHSDVAVIEVQRQQDRRAA